MDFIEWTAAQMHCVIMHFQNLRIAFDNEAEATGRPRLLLTAAVGAGKSTIEKGYEIGELSK